MIPGARTLDVVTDMAYWRAMRHRALRFLRPRSSNVVRVLAILFVLAACRPAYATTYDVDRLDDDASQTACTAAANDCTLRGAIIAANAHPGADVINIPNGTYDLTLANPPGTHETASLTGDLNVTDDVLISGTAVSSTIIDGGQLDRVFETDPNGTGITVTIQSLTIQNGKTAQIGFVHAEGGAIRNGVSDTTSVNVAGTLHLFGVVVKDSISASNGGGISNDGTMTITDSVVMNNTAGNVNVTGGGGGIDEDDDGTLTITRTTISGNHAGTGGAGGGITTGRFANNNPKPIVTIDGSTISGNTAFTGGGIYHNTGDVTLTNSTISGNTATATSASGGGGIADAAGGTDAMLLINCTVSNNTASVTASGGGIQNNGITTGTTTKLANTIVAGNHAGSGIDISGNMISGGYNLIGSAAGFSVDLPHSDTTGDQVGVANPGLGPLQLNGGITETHALLPGSPAIDAGNPASNDGTGLHCRAQDEVGNFRPVDGDGSGTAQCDIGAFESIVVPKTPTPTITPSATKTATPTITVSPTATRTATATPTLTPTKTATPEPTVTATPPATMEECGNCVDDDGDGLVDRDDPDCDQPLDGGAQGVGDAARAKRLVKCAGAIQKAGAKLESKHLARFQKCFAAAFTCVELKNGDAKCGAKARGTCDKAFAAIPADAAALAAKLSKACGASVVDPNDLVGPTGLAYGGHAARCTSIGAPAPVDATTLGECVAAEQACRADALLGVQVPRVGELLALAGRTAGALPCLAARTGAGLGLGDAKRGKAAVKCEQAIEKAGAKLVSGEVKLVPKCANAVLACLELPKSGCATKSSTTCTKTQLKVDALAAKLSAAVAKACTAAGPSDVADANGVGFDGLAPTCAAADVPSLASVADVTACLTKFHDCRAHQLLENQIPRLRELLGIGQLALP